MGDRVQAARRRASEPGRSVTIVAQDVCISGGMELAARELVRGLLERGWSVYVVARTCDLAPAEGLQFVRVPGPRRPFPLGYPWFWIVAGILCQLRAVGLLHAMGANVPQRLDVVTVHFLHRAARRSQGERHADRPLAWRLSGLISARLSLLAEAWVYRQSRLRRVIAVSRGLAREIGIEYPSLRRLLAVIPNGVDGERFRPDRTARSDGRKQLSITGEELLAVFVGGDWGRKGLRHAIEALAQADRWHLVVVGEGPRSDYQRIAETMSRDLLSRIHFVGRTAYPERWFAAGDAFLLPSAYEAFPLVTLEAAASGLPLLVSKTHGSDQLVSEGVTGWFVRPDGADIARRLHALSDPSIRRTMGHAARATTEAFEWSSVVDEYERVYFDLLTRT